METRYTVAVDDGRTFWSDLGTVIKMAEAGRDALDHPSLVRLRQLWSQIGDELNQAEHD